MHISELHVFPVKGARGLSPAQARLDACGLEHDRRWMVVDTAGTFVTPREVARLALVETALETDALVLRSAVGGVARVPLEQETGDEVEVVVWHDRVPALDAGGEAAELLTRHLGFEARLVRMPASTHRQVSLEYGAAGDRVSFADAFPLLIISQAALDELNRRLAEPVPMLRFRPNVVVAGARPHEEDEWRRVRLGAVACDVVKPCGRCVVTTLDLTTAEGGKEPLRTLAGYRKWESNVWFGQNAIHRATGTLRVGDEVNVLERGAARPPVATAGAAGAPAAPAATAE
jgi:uncharacterized protein